MAEIPEKTWKKILWAKSVARDKFSDEDGKQFLNIWAKKNGVGQDWERPKTDYEQGRIDVIQQLIDYVEMDEIEFIEKIKERQNEIPDEQGL